MTNTSDILTVTQARRELGVSRPTFMKWLRRGDFPGAFQGEKVWRIPASDIAAFKARYSAKSKFETRVDQPEAKSPPRKRTGSRTLTAA